MDARCLEHRKQEQPLILPWWTNARSEDVIGMTTTACAMNWAMLKQIGVQIVICEEAGEVMEAQFLCTLFPSVEHAISIGDPLQLR